MSSFKSLMCALSVRVLAKNHKQFIHVWTRSKLTRLSLMPRPCSRNEAVMLQTHKSVLQLPVLGREGSRKNQRGQGRGNMQRDLILLIRFTFQASNTETGAQQGCSVACESVLQLSIFGSEELEPIRSLKGIQASQLDRAATPRQHPPARN